MKSIIFTIIFGLSILIPLGTSGSSSLDDRPAILSVVSSENDQVVIFDAAYVSGDSSATSALDYSQRRTPFRLEIPSPYFFGIFKKVSGDAGIVVSIKTQGAVVRATSSTVLITRSGKTIKSEGF